MELNEKQITLLNKWLNHEATDQDVLEIKQDSELFAYIKISGSVSRFASPDFDRENLFQKVNKAKNRSKKKSGVIKYLMPIAAAIAVLITVYTFLPQGELKQYEVAFAESQVITLPDASEVIVNSGSTISYSTKKWQSERQINLNGEAFFKVAKGKKFTVKTEKGDVSVLGTQFNVKQRAGIFQVSCYEGRVEVQAGSNKVVLTAGEFVQMQNGQLHKQSISVENPSWINGESAFENETLQEVIAELERQYDIKVYLDKDVNLYETFTGGFTNNQLEEALKTICLPLQLQYTIENSERVRIYVAP
ncbi:MAG: FecR domain-containing protein [Flavobacteriaceae bacterium]|nr:FecR domain-containing protein [Flavobacteriaceae bacterium]